MTEIELHQTTSLALTSDQPYWNDRQLAALRHMGVEHAGEGDLTVFHHVCTRTGLDPFARQIYMIGRQANENINGEWVKSTKYTIQTGIDGFRLIGRRAADRAKHSVSVSAPEWAHEDGSWRPVWIKAWGFPVAARVIIKRGGEPFEAVALFDEYKQTKRSGDLTQMWAQRPAGQIAKCAEALAWRMAFPQDLSGIYTDDEMAQADVAPAAAAPPSGGLGAALEGRVVAEHVEVHEPDSGEAMTDKSRREMFALFTQKGVVEDEQLPGINHLCGSDYTSRGDLTEADCRRVIDMLRSRPDVEAEVDQ